MMALFPPSSKIFLPDKQIIKMQCHEKKIIKNVILQLCGTNCAQCILKISPQKKIKLPARLFCLIQYCCPIYLQGE